MAEMRRSTSALAFVVLGVGALGAGGAGSLGCRKSLVDVPMAWESDAEVGLAKAKAQNKPIVVYFGATWDTAAKELDQVTFTDAQVRLLLGRDFVSVRVDSSDDDDPLTRRLLQRFNVVGDPTIVIYGSDGTSEIRRINEFVPPAVLAQMLKEALRSDAVREARFEAAARARTEEAHWDEERRKADLLGPASVIIITTPDPP
jgi:thiol:disulfide interchange protein